MYHIYQDLLHQYIDNELAPYERLIIDEHIQMCNHCRQELNQLKIMDWDLAHMDIEIPVELAQVRRNCVKDHIQHPSRIGIKEVVGLQRLTIKKSVSFMNYLPTNRFVEKAGSQLVKTTENLLKRRMSNNFLRRTLGIREG